MGCAIDPRADATPTRFQTFLARIWFGLQQLVPPNEAQIGTIQIKEGTWHYYLTSQDIIGQTRRHGGGSMSGLELPDWNAAMRGSLELDFQFEVSAERQARSPAPVVVIGCVEQVCLGL